MVNDARPRVQAGGAGLQASKGRILLIEDSEWAYKPIIYLLERAGYDVEHITWHSEAEHRLETSGAEYFSSFDAIITDGFTDCAHGYEPDAIAFVARLRAVDQATPVIAFSTRLEANEAIMCAAKCGLTEKEKAATAGRFDQKDKACNLDEGAQTALLETVKALISANRDRGQSAERS